MVERRKLDWRQVVIAILTAIIAALGGGTMTATYQGCQPPPEPPPEQSPPKPPEPPPPATNPTDAVGRLIIPGAFCSATAVGPRKDDGRWWIVSAAHCIRGKGGVGMPLTFITRKGVSLPVTVVAVDISADIILCTTNEKYEALDNVLVASATPSPGTAIYHVGFGMDKPGNREDGQILALPNTSKQVRYRLSVSPGDSGGGILVTDAGRLLSPVCCTTCLGCVGDVWGGAPERIQEMMARPTAFIDLPPAVMPEPPKE